MKKPRGKQHMQEQIIRKLRETDTMLAAGIGEQSRFAKLAVCLRVDDYILKSSLQQISQAHYEL
jgi:hypothetical protein